MPTIGSAEIKLPKGKRPRLRKLNLSIAIAVRKAAPQPNMYPDRAPFTKVCTKSIHRMSNERENFKAIADGAGNKIGFICNPITANSHIKRITIPNKDGTINLGKLASLYSHTFVLIHHPPSQIMKKRNKKVFI